MYVLKQIKINICWNFVHKGLIYIFYILLICKVHNLNVHIVKPIGILYYVLGIQYSVDFLTKLLKYKHLYFCAFAGKGWLSWSF